MADLIERLRGYAEAEDLHVDERATLLEAADALEAAREDAANMATDAMLLRQDAERLDWLADQMRITELHDILGSVPLEPCDLRSAIDQARGKGGAE